MSKASMPINVGDYLTVTRHLSTAERGAYLLLVIHQWTTGSLPNDDRQLARIVKLSLPKWRKIRPVIEAFFEDGWQRHKGHWVNRRA
jgi:uncharacterized protein YdaU (DUF1376 family)